VPRAIVVEETDEEDKEGRVESGMGDTEIVESRESAQSRCDQIVGYEEKGSCEGQPLGSTSDTGIYPSPIRVVFADDDVVQSDKQREDRDGEDGPERGVSP
jgi:hypothetical protein